MWLNEQRYRQYLDFDYIAKEMSKMPEDGVVIHNLDDIPKESLKFFRDLANATSVSELAEYSAKDIVDYAGLMLDSIKIIQYIGSYFQDDSILGDKDKLIKNISCRRLAAKRRIL